MSDGEWFAIHILFFTDVIRSHFEVAGERSHESIGEIREGHTVLRAFRACKRGNH